MKVYLVTGGAGFIGSNYINYLMDTYGENIKIINADKLTYASDLNHIRTPDSEAQYVFEQTDICDPEAVRRLFERYDVDYVVHFAAESHVDRSIEDPGIFVRTNVEGTVNLLEAAKSAWQTGEGIYRPDRRFLHVSTDEVYGALEASQTYFYETSPCRPRNPYAASKASADMMVKSYMDTYGFPANITRCCNNFGPGQHEEKLIPHMIRKALRGEKLPIYGDGRHVRDWIYVEDHVRAIDMVLRKGRLFETYNIGAHQELENIQVVKWILKVLRELLPAEDMRIQTLGENLITYVKDRRGHDRKYAISPDKLMRETGWTAKVSFEHGITWTVQWYLKQENYQ